MTLTKTPTQERATPGSPRRSRRLWLWVGLAVVIALSVALVVVLQKPTSTRALDPRSPAPEGAMALANILGERGTNVRTVESLAQALEPKASNTLVIINGSLIGEEAGEALLKATSDRVIVVGGQGGATPDWIQDVTSGLTQALSARCEEPSAAAAGAATFRLTLNTDALVRCFPGEDGYGLAQQDRITVLADGLPLMNSDLAESGNAALGLNLMSSTEYVTWFLPSPADPGLTPGRQTGLTELLPGWVGLALLQLLIAFAALIIWRGRRLGPLVREPLPIQVPAHETDEGFANLLQRNQDISYAADAIREQSVASLAVVCGLPRHASAEVVAGAVATRLGESPGPIADLLQGRTPSTPAELITIRNELNALSRRVGNR